MRGGVTIFRSAGAAAARTYLEKDTSRPDDYYLQEGSGLADHWVLEGTGSLASKNAVDGDAYEAWVDWTDLETGESKGKPRTTTVVNAEGVQSIVPTSPRFYEMTVNCDKTLSIAAALHPEISEALDAAQEDAARTMLEYLAVNSTTRVGAKGAQEFMGVKSLEAMSVVHHTNRAGDPHRHIHLQVNSRVLAEDGTWRGIAGGPLMRQQGVLRGLGEAAIAANPQLRASLAAYGFTFDAATGAVTELAEYREVLSKRAVQIQEQKAELEAAWRAEHPGVEPGPRVVRSWDQQAWALNRPDKTPATMPSQALWQAELEAAGYVPPAGPAIVPATGVGTLDRDSIAAEAVALAQAKRSTWGTTDLGEHVARLVAASGVAAERAVLVETVEDITARAEALCSSVAPEGWREGNLPAGYRHLTSEHVVRIEREIGEYLTHAALSGENPQDLDQEKVQALVELSNVEGEKEGEKPVSIPDSEGQRAALRAMSGNHRLVTVTGAAGSGKTTVLIAAKSVVDAQGRTQLLVAPTMKAAQVAGAEVGSLASSVHKLLRENGWRWEGDDEKSWHRLSLGEMDPATGKPWAGVPEAYRLTAQTQLVVDEAGMLSQETAHKLLALTHEARAQVVMLGDRAQLAAVGRGGVLDMAAKSARAVVDLDQVHRFKDLAYAEVSLMMREHRNLDAAFDHLIAHDLVEVHATEKDALEVVAAEYISDSAENAVALTVATNSEATALNETIRASREALGDVAPATAVGSDDLGIGVGDLVMVRRNDTRLGVANRETFTVKDTHEGSLIVADPDGRLFTLPADYVVEHVHLGYAVTGHGNQGITTTTSHTLMGDGTDAAGAYVGMTRGREANTLHLVATDLDEAREQFKEAFARDNADRGLEVARAELGEQLAPYRPVPAAALVAVAEPLSAQEMAQIAVQIPKHERALKDTTNEYQYRNEVQRYKEAAQAWRASGKPTLPELRQDASTARNAATRAEVAAGQLREAQLEAVAEAFQKPTYQAIVALREAKEIEAHAGMFKRAAARAQVSAAEAAAMAMAPGVPLPENINDPDQVVDWRRAAIHHQQAQTPVTEEQSALQTQAQKQQALARDLEQEIQAMEPEWNATMPERPVAPSPRIIGLQKLSFEDLRQRGRQLTVNLKALTNAEQDPDRARPLVGPAPSKAPAPAAGVELDAVAQEEMNPIHDQSHDGPGMGY